jgi:serine O-acetyltransferase
VKPELIWAASRKFHSRGSNIRARISKALVFLLFRAVLPPEAIVGSRLRLGHWGMNVVVHPSVTIGSDVTIWHGVTIAVSDKIESSSRIIIGDRVSIGAGAVIVSRTGEGLVVCDDVTIGANAVVTRDIKLAGTYVGIPAKRVTP